MTAPSAALQKAVVVALKSDGPLQALIGSRIYDAVPKNSPLPYVSFGPSDVEIEEADEYVGYDETFQLDVWSTGLSSSGGMGRVEVKRIAGGIVDAIHQAVLTLENDNRLVSLTVEQVRYLTEPDGVSQHAAISVRARIEPS